MTKSVEAFADAHTVTARTAGRPFRQDWSPTPLLVLDPDHLEPSVRTIVSRILELERSRGCGAYLFVSPLGQAFVLSEEKPAAMQWVRDRFGWLVGFYRTVRPSDPNVPVLRTDVDGVTEDLVDHLAGLARAAA